MCLQEDWQEDCIQMLKATIEVFDPDAICILALKRDDKFCLVIRNERDGKDPFPSKDEGYRYIAKIMIPK